MLVDDLINDCVMGCIALHPSIEELELEKHFNRPLTLPIAAVAQPFQRLNNLSLTADVDCLNILLPRMKNLEWLELTVYGMTSVFPSLRELQNLKFMWLKFMHYSLSDSDMTYLVPLKRLGSLELDSHNDGEDLDATLLDTDLFAAVLGSLPSFTSLKLIATNDLSDPFLIALGRQCRILQDLTITGNFTLEPLATESSVLFPHLLSLELGALAPSTNIRQWGGFREFWADQRAQDVLRHAPQLVGFYCCQDGRNEFGGLVEEAWKRLKRDGDVYIGGR